jgi:hypothetical protein
MLPIPQQELTGNADSAPTTTIVVALVVFLAIAIVANNYPKVGRPLQVMVLGVLALEAFRTGL